MTRDHMIWVSLASLLMAIIMALMLVVCLTGCNRPAPRTSVDAGGIPRCSEQPVKIYYGSCGSKLAQNAPFTESPLCVLCDGARGCMPSVGAYCTNDLACDDPRCR